MSVLHFLHNEDTMKITYALNVAEFRAHEFLIRIHVARLNLQREIILATRVVAFRYLFDILDSLHEIIHEQLRVMPEAHVAEHRYPVARLLRVEYGMIAFDEPLALQSLLPDDSRRS